MLFWRFLYLAPVVRCFTQVQLEVDVCQVEFSGKNRWQVDDVHGMFPFLDRKGSWLPATLMATASPPGLIPPRAWRPQGPTRPHSTTLATTMTLLAKFVRTTGRRQKREHLL